jgi:hypothetical protein
MRLSVLAALVLAGVWPHLAAADEFPFEGYVAASETVVASGPGRRFYTTDKLPRGAQVEVYREDDAGWLAIRPPEGSFSWIPAEHVELLGDGVGKVRSATESWIGTTVEQVQKHKSQVSLKPGDLVQILDQKTVQTEGRSDQWLKIAPPAGEFRYVHSRDVSREPVEPEPTPAPASEPPAAASLTPEPSDQESREPRPFRPSHSAIALRDIDEVRSKLAVMRDDLASLAGRSSQPRAGGASESGFGQGVQLAQFKASSSASSLPLSPDGFVPRKRRSSELLEPVPAPDNRMTQSHTTTPRSNPRPPSRISDARPATPAFSTVSGPRGSSAVASGGLSQQLEQLEVELSLMVAQDKSTWNLASLRQQVERLVETGPTPADRGQARLLLDKIKQFEEAFAVSSSGPFVAESLAATAAAPGSSPLSPRYDAQGWLKPVISRTKPAAPYAVVDDDGKPLCFVTPSPGLNIGRYANQQVGLYGRRGYIESLKTPHLVAERVIDLDRHVR